MCLIIDDKEDHSESYISKILNIIKKRKKLKTIPNVEKITPDNELSMTTVLSKVEVPKNNDIIGSIRDNKEKKDNENDVPKIIKVIK